jgi:hypothetical protein
MVDRFRSFSRGNAKLISDYVEIMDKRMTALKNAR